MATSAVSGRDVSKSFLPMASVLKAFPMAAGQADSAGFAGAGGSGFSETATFSEALKAARRPVRESAEKPEKAEEAEKETKSQSEADAEKRADRVREKPAAAARSADRRRSKEGADKSSRRSSKADDAHRDHGPGEDDSTGVSASEQAAGQSQTGADKPVSAEDKPTGEAGADETAVKDATVGDPAAQAVAVSGQVTPVVTTQAAVSASPVPAASTDSAADVQAAAATAQSQAPKKAAARGDKAEKRPGDGKMAKTEGAEGIFAKKELRQAADPDDDAAGQQDGGDDSAGSNKPQHAQNMSAFGKAVAKIATGSQTADATAPGEPAAPTTPSPAMQAVQGALAETLATPPRAGAPVEHDAAKPVSGAAAISGSTGTNSAAAADESADAAAPAQQSPASDSDQTFEQVVMGLRGKLDPRSGKAEIRLDPPNLGTLHVSVQLSNGSLTAQFQSSSDVVRDLLKSNMEKLKSVLQGQGVTVDKLAVESPSDKAVTAAAKMPASGSPNNDGRSAGQYTRDPQSGQKRTPGSGNGSGSFARKWRDATNAADAPIDIVG